jgi:hypothetical protein
MTVRYMKSKKEHIWSSTDNLKLMRFLAPGMQKAVSTASFCLISRCVVAVWQISHTYLCDKRFGSSRRGWMTKARGVLSSSREDPLQRVKGLGEIEWISLAVLIVNVFKSGASNWPNKLLELTHGTLILADKLPTAEYMFSPKTDEGPFIHLHIYTFIHLHIYTFSIRDRSVSGQHDSHLKVCDDAVLQQQTSWTLSIVLILIKNYVSETEICLRPQVEATLLGSIDRASPYLRRLDPTN